MTFIMPGISVLAIVLLWLPAASALHAQVESRAQEIERARDEKAARLEPETVTRTEAALNYIKDRKILERITAGVAGFRVGFGGLISGSGFALGPEYLRRDLLRGDLILRASARSSFKAYQLYELEADLPRLSGGNAFAGFSAAHRNYPGVNYYGPGPKSSKQGRSNYRLEDTSVSGTAGVAPLPRLRLGGGGGSLWVNVGPGTDRRFVSAEQIYSPRAAPGIGRQTDFLTGNVFVQYDYRDHPGGPRSGGNYLVRFSYFGDRALKLHTFRRLDAEAQQYISFFNQRRVIALRALATLTYPNAGQVTPFYMQPVLGGSETLRGFRPFRFHDNNLFLMNAEYRWETFSGLDMALFFDAGKVFPRRGQLNFHDLEGSAGFGFRFNVRNSVFLRIDTGFSREGYQVWLKFQNVF